MYIFLPLSLILFSWFKFKDRSKFGTNNSYVLFSHFGTENGVSAFGKDGQRYTYSKLAVSTFVSLSK